MLTIAVDSGLENPCAADLCRAFEDHGAGDAVLWEGNSLRMSAGVNVLVCGDVSFHRAARQLRTQRGLQLVVVAAGVTASASRQLVRDGVDSIVDPAQLCAHEIAVCCVAVAVGAFVLPTPIVADLTTRVADPPRPLSSAEATLLAVAATTTIEGAGRKLGYSRRQIQRRFRRLCDDLGLRSHIEAAAAAGRWGLLDR